MYRLPSVNSNHRRRKARAMGWKKLAGTTGAVVLAAVTLSVPAAATQGNALFVAPDGHGAACTRHLPCALETATAKRNRGGDLTVFLDGGTYRLTRTLELGPAAGKVSYRALPGAAPVMSGARRITGFALFD